MISIRFDKSDFKKTFESLNPKMKKKRKEKEKSLFFVHYVCLKNHSDWSFSRRIYLISALA